MPRKKQKKITKVMYGDDAKSLIRIFYDDNTNQYCSTQSPQYKQVIKKWPVDIIERETEAFKFYYTQRELRFKDFNDNYEIWRGFWRGEQRAGSDNSVLERVLNIHESPQPFFKLKLSIFEMKRVRENKNREWKASLRKAQTGLELLALLYQEIPDLESEQVEPEDEIFLPETANLEDSADSSQQSTDKTSDAPNE